MHQMTLRETEMVGGSKALTYFISQSISEWFFGQLMEGNIDYASIAEQDGHYYNMTGA